MDPLWRIEMFGGLRARVPGAAGCGDHVVSRFRSRKAGALLAYLAFYRDRAHPRERLIELLWPDEPLESARPKLWTALSSLRRQLEPPGVPAGTVIVSTRRTVRLDPAAVTTDVAAFEAALAAAARARSVDEQARRLDEAIALSRGPLLPGYYEAWVLPEQQRLSERLSQALCEMIGRLEQAGQLDRALEYAGRAVAVDPLREEAHYDLIRLYAAAGQITAARRQYREWERLLREELHEEPSTALQELMLRLDRGALPALPAGLPPPPAPAGPADQTGAVPPSLPPAAPRPPESGDEARGYLPPTLARFFGREPELARLRKLLLAEGVRLVTLTGPGGSGKTRLALEAAARLRDALDGAVWFVPLADLSDPRRIIDAIHAALRLPRQPQVEPLEQIVEALSRRASLLLLDNFEQLMPTGVPVVRDLLERAPLLQCLVTSRRILELTPEREIAVGPLPVPGIERIPYSVSDNGEPALAAAEYAIRNTHCAASLSALLANESIALFVDRAQAAMPHFQLTPTNAAAVADLCRCLEGIPLAIELAAARAQRLSPSRMLAELERRFDLLVSRKRGLSRRHQTLRAALDWSYQLLPPELQRFFAHLFPFRGGFTLEAAAAVAGEPLAPPTQAGEYLRRLHSSSLVQTEGAGRDGGRFRLLETLREFAAEKLPAKERSRAARRHAQHYLVVAEAAAPVLQGGAEQKQWLDRLEAEHDNFRAALDWAQSGNQDEMSIRLTLALELFWWIRGYFPEARDRLTTLLRLPEAAAPTLVRAAGLRALGRIVSRLGEYDQARSLGEEELAIRRCLGDGPGLAAALRELGAGAQEQGDYGAACRFLEESLSLSEGLADQRQIAYTLNSLGLTLVYSGQYEPARELLEHSLLLNQQREDQHAVSINLNNLGLLALRQGRLVEARFLFTRSLRLKRDLGHEYAMVYGLSGLAELEMAEGQFQRAVHLYAAADAAGGSAGHPRCPPTERANDVRLLAAARESIGAAAFTAAWSEGGSWTFEQMIAFVSRTEPSDQAP